MGAALRIVGGALGGRRFGRPGPRTRPTSDRVREALASILEARVELTGARVLELFSGTGACSFELLSRGAANAVLADQDAEASADAKQSGAILGLADKITMKRADLMGRGRESLPPGPFDIVLLDPPYAIATEALALLTFLSASGRLAPGALIAFEHRTGDAKKIDGELASDAFASSRLSVVSRYRYGDTRIVLLSAPPSDASAELKESDEA